jgi:ABC-type microcin C transport system duplicated ATPase subunit YejF
MLRADRVVVVFGRGRRAVPAVSYVSLSLAPGQRLQQVILEPLAAAGALPAPAERPRLAVQLAESVGLAGELLGRFPHEAAGMPG